MNTDKARRSSHAVTPTNADKARRSTPAVTVTPATADKATVVVGLCRCSSDRQDRSIGDQETAIRGWAKQHRARVLQVFKDEGVSGLDLRRPGLTACLDFIASSSQKGTVVIWSRDRLVRPEDPIDGLLMERQIRHAGWELCYLTGSNSTGNALVDAILGLVEHHASGEYLRRLARDSLRNVIARLRAGDVPGGKIPYGYAKVLLDEQGVVQQTIPRLTKHRKARHALTRLVPGDPAEVEALRWVFAECARGWSSYRDLADALERRGAPRPTPSKPWSQGTLVAMLRNPVYMGDIVWNRATSARCVRWLGGQLSQKLATHPSRITGERTAWGKNAPEDQFVFPDRHQPLVSRDQFAAVQAALKARDEAECLPTRRTHLLTGLLFCGTCGNRMHSASSVMRGVFYRYYVCFAGMTSGDHGCRIRGDVLDQAVLDALRNCLDPVDRGLSRRRLNALLDDFRSAVATDDAPQRNSAIHSLVARVTLRASSRAAPGGARRIVSATLVVQGGSRRCTFDLLTRLPARARAGPPALD